MLKIVEQYQKDNHNLGQNSSQKNKQNWGENGKSHLWAITPIRSH